MAKTVEGPWYVTWTCGHKALLEETLAKSEWPRERILVVDYSCPDGTAWISKRGLGQVIHAHAQLLVDGTPIVSRARALNAALLHLAVRSTVLLGDPQLYPITGTLDVVREVSGVSVPSRPHPAAIGCLVSDVGTLRDVGGYLPAYVGHGAESPDLRLRLRRHNVPIVTCDLPIGVAAGYKVRMWGSAALLERRFGLLTGSSASDMVRYAGNEARLLGLVA